MPQTNSFEWDKKMLKPKLGMQYDLVTPTRFELVFSP